jgi:hypothetical protein
MLLNVSNMDRQQQQQHEQHQDQHQQQQQILHDHHSQVVQHEPVDEMLQQHQMQHHIQNVEQHQQHVQHVQHVQSSPVHGIQQLPHHVVAASNISMVSVAMNPPRSNPTPEDLAQRKWGKLMEDSSTVIWLDRSDEALETYTTRKTLRCLLCPAVFIAYPDTGNINKHCRTELHKSRVAMFLRSQGLNSTDSLNFACPSSSSSVGMGSMGDLMPLQGGGLMVPGLKFAGKKRKLVYINENPVGDIYLSGEGSAPSLVGNSTSMGMDDLGMSTKVRRSQEELTTRKWNRLLADPSTARWLDQSTDALSTYRTMKTLRCLICPAEFIAYPDTGNINKHCRTDLHKRRMASAAALVTEGSKAVAAEGNRVLDSIDASDVQHHPEEQSHQQMLGLQEQAESQQSVQQLASVEVEPHHCQQHEPELLQSVQHEQDQHQSIQHQQVVESAVSVMVNNSDHIMIDDNYGSNGHYSDQQM